MGWELLVIGRKRGDDFGGSLGSAARFDVLTLVENGGGVNAKEPTICAKAAVSHQRSAVRQAGWRW